MSKKRVFTEEETKFIIQKYKNGSTLGEIRKILGCKSIKITNCLSENNIELRNRYWFQKSGLMKFETKLDPAKHLELSKEYENGAKIKDLVEKYGISHQTILTTIRKAGGKIKKKGEGCRKILNEQQKNQIIDLHNAGNTPSEISIETKIHEQRIKKFLIQSNIETNKKIKIRKLTPPNQIDLERFLFLYNQNLSLTKISIELEVSYPRIKKIIASLNLPKRKQVCLNKVIIEESALNQIKEDIKNNISINQISEKYNVSRDVLIRNLKENQIKNTYKKGNIHFISEETKLKIIKEYNSGKKLFELAKEHHVSVPNLRKILVLGGATIRTMQHNQESIDIIIHIWKNTNLSQVKIIETLNITHKTLIKLTKNIKKSETNIKTKEDETIDSLIKKFHLVNHVCKRRNDNLELSKQVRDLFVNSNLFRFEILKELNITKDQFKRWTRGLKRLNPPKCKGGETYFYLKWKSEFGEDKANQLLKELKDKQRFNSSGKNNPMFSVPAPQGAGVGWKGWYKGIYFRSLREVSYLLYLDKNNISWTPAEKKKYTIPYINWDGAERTYRPDFLINNDTLIEIKPKRLQKSPNVMAKTKAALIWAAENGLKYEIIDFPINQSEILNQIDQDIKFDRDYKEKFLKYVKIKN